MVVLPTPNKRQGAHNGKPATPVPLRRGAPGQLVFIAVTPAVESLARVARAMAEERRNGRQEGSSGPETRGKPAHSKVPRNLHRRRGSTTD